VSRFPLLAAALALAAGCAASPSLYYWGHYEDLVYASYAEPGKVDPAQQIRIMEADAESARAQNRSVPPGFHAHLGVLYFDLGKPERARQEFLAEKGLFPESAVLMDRLLARLPP
jgi:hypothetical protein